MADLDCSACLPATVHTLWLNAVLLEIEHLVNVRPRFRSNTHHIEKCPVITVVHSTFHHVFQKEITMSRTTEFNIIMLNQASTDRLELAKLLNISDLQMSYITNVGAGQGLLKVGSSLVPFVNKFPRNTELYKLMTTKFGEV